MSVGRAPLHVAVDLAAAYVTFDDAVAFGVAIDDGALITLYATDVEYATGMVTDGYSTELEFAWLGAALDAAADADVRDAGEDDAAPEEGDDDAAADGAADDAGALRSALLSALLAAALEAPPRSKLRPPALDEAAEAAGAADELAALLTSGRENESGVLRSASSAQAHDTNTARPSQRRRIVGKRAPPLPPDGASPECVTRRAPISTPTVGLRSAELRVMQARRRCAVCGSTRFRLVAAQLVCAAGHVQRDFRVEAAHDEDGFGTQITTRARAVNRASQREAAHAERRRRQYLARKVARGRTPLVVPGSKEHAALDDHDAAYLYGARATFAVLEALQLVLRHQVAAVERLYGIQGLAAAAREVWALHVSSAGVPPTPLDAACDAAERPTHPPPASMPRTGRQRWSDAAHHAASLDLVSLRSTVATVYLALVRRRCPISIGQLRTYVGPPRTDAGTSSRARCRTCTRSMCSPRG